MVFFTKLLACFVLLVGMVGASARAADSPHAALAQAQRGIDEARSDLFNAAVDVASVVNRASDDLIALLKEQAAGGALRGDFGGGNIATLLALAASVEGSAQAALLRPLLITEVRNFVAIGINGGYFAGKADLSLSPPRSSLALVLTKMPEGRREIVPGRIISQADGKARVAAVFNDPGAGGLPLELIVEQREGIWRVVEIANTKELFYEVTKRSQ